MKKFSCVLLASLIVGVLLAADTTHKAVPSYMNEKEANKKLPATLPPSNFTDPQTARSYEVAKEIPKVLAQLPCYCWCSRGGHKGLLDCYVTEHASHCGICKKEALFAEKLTKEGKSPAEIRTLIEQNAWVTTE